MEHTGSIQSLTDIPEIASISSRRFDTPWPESRQTSTSTLNESICSSSSQSRPFLVTSVTPTISLGKRESGAKLVDLSYKSPQETWIRVELPASTICTADNGKEHGEYSAAGSTLPLSSLMNRFQSDLKDAGVHQLQLIEGGQGKPPRSAINDTDEDDQQEIPWCSVYAISKIAGLILLATGLLCMAYFGSAARNAPDTVLSPQALEGDTPISSLATRPTPTRFAMVDTPQEDVVTDQESTIFESITTEFIDTTKP